MLQVSDESVNEDDSPPFFITENKKVFSHTFKDLEPYTDYKLLLKINFVSGASIDWPSPNALIHKTERKKKS